jgi:lipopolysaccharide heptosyltransferase I
MESPRILIVRLSAIGDVIQGMPVPCALRDRFPGAFLAWAVEERAASLLRNHEALDELIVLPHGWLKSPGGVWQLRRRLHDLRFDIAIDVQGLTKSALLAWLSGAPRRIGFGNPGGREFSKWFNRERVDPKAVHMVDRYLELVQPLGITSPTVRFQVPESEEDRQAAEHVLREAKFASEYAVINPGAGWPSKLWPTDRYALVAKHLMQRHQLPSLVLWGNESEKAMAERIRSDSDGAAIVAPRITLGAVAALSRRSRLFIGSDTGPIHLAAAVGATCVGLYGPWPGSRHGPYGKQNVVLQQMVMEGTTHERRNAPPIYMESITVAMACDACDRILQSPTIKATY